MTEDPQAGNTGAGQSAPVPAVREPAAQLVNYATGEVLPATPANAAAVLAALRAYRDRILDAVKDCEAIIRDESRRVGAKTLHFGALTASVGPDTDVTWDVQALRDGLHAVGCPQERLDDLIRVTVEEKVNQTVARQLAAANDDYRAAVEAAKQRQPVVPRVTTRHEGGR